MLKKRKEQRLNLISNSRWPAIGLWVLVVEVQTAVEQPRRNVDLIISMLGTCRLVWTTMQIYQFETVGKISLQSRFEAWIFNTWTRLWPWWLLIDETRSRGHNGWTATGRRLSHRWREATTIANGWNSGSQGGWRQDARTLLTSPSCGHVTTWAWKAVMWCVARACAITWAWKAVEVAKQPAAAWFDWLFFG
jgi:DMSO reductase anchor subunit